MGERITVGKCRQLLELGDEKSKRDLASLLEMRLLSRYFDPHLGPAKKTFLDHPGFLMAASACMMIESLQRHRMEFLAKSTERHGAKIFEAFFSGADRPPALCVTCGGGISPAYKRARTNAFKNLGTLNDCRLDFYQDIRCGILHVGEIRNGWKLWRYCYKEQNEPIRDPFNSALPICDPDRQKGVIYADRLLVCVADEVSKCCAEFAAGKEWESFRSAMEETIKACQPRKSK